MLRLLEAVWQDVRYGGRVIRKNPALSLTIVITLALGIGANTTIFGVINAVLLEPLPYKDPDRLVRLWQSNPSQNQIEAPVSAPNFWIGKPSKLHSNNLPRSNLQPST